MGLWSWMLSYIIILDLRSGWNWSRRRRSNPVPPPASSASSARSLSSSTGSRPESAGRASWRTARRGQGWPRPSLPKQWNLSTIYAKGCVIDARNILKLLPLLENIALKPCFINHISPSSILQAFMCKVGLWISSFFACVIWQFEANLTEVWRPAVN